MLIEPECQGTICRCGGLEGASENRILFANPASKEARRNGTVWLSYDEGCTWPVARTVYEGSFAYSMQLILPFVFNVIVWGSFVGWYCRRRFATAMCVRRAAT